MGDALYILLGNGVTPLSDLRQVTGINFSDGNGSGRIDWTTLLSNLGVSLPAPNRMHYSDVTEAHNKPSDGILHNIPNQLTADDID